MKLNNKKILILILGLAILNLAFAFDIFYLQGAEAQQRHCFNREKSYYHPGSYVVPESRDCTFNCEPVNKGKTLFKYYGEEADCLGEECREKFPYGGPGTLEVGGNWIMEDTQGLFFNGWGDSGYHWIMNGSPVEPMGRIMGFRTRTSVEDAFFGRSIVVGKDLNLKGRINLAFGNYINKQEKKYLVNSTRRDIKEISFNDNFHVLKGYKPADSDTIKGICGMGNEDVDNPDDPCWPWTGSNYRTQLDGKTKIKSSLKIDDEFYIPYYVNACLNCHCCPFAGPSRHTDPEYKKQDVKHYYGYEEDTLKEELVGYHCQEDSEDNGCRIEPSAAWGMYFTGVPGYASACHTQPNTHYKIVNYRYEEGSGITGDVAICPSNNPFTYRSLGTYMDGGKVRRSDFTDSVQQTGCEKCASTTVEGARTWGCP